MTLSRWIAAPVVATALVGVGCGSTSSRSGGAKEPVATTTTTHHDHAKMAGKGMASSACPMNVPGTTVTSENVTGGEALVFKTSGDVEALRAHAHEMADMHNRHSAVGGGPHGGEGMHHGGMMGMPQSTATAEDVEGGARVVFKPADTSTLDTLRKHVSTSAQHMTAGQCSMMGMPGK